MLLILQISIDVASFLYFDAKGTECDTKLNKNNELTPLHVLPPLLAGLEITAKEISLSFMIFMCNLNM